MHPPAPAHIYSLTRDDRVFLAGVSRRLRRRTLDLPALPRVVIRLAETERKGDRPLSEYAEILSEDAALSLEVLRAVNSDLFSGQLKVVNLSDAILRLGLSRLHAMIMATHLRTKVLVGASVRREGELLMDLAAPLALLASRIVPPEIAVPDESFMRGMLMHVEHLIVLGTVADISREHQRAVTPSIAAIHEAFIRFGPDIRQAVAAAWEVDSLLVSQDRETELSTVLSDLRRAIVHRWLRQSLPEVPGVDAQRLEALIAEVDPRVPAATVSRAG